MYTTISKCRACESQNIKPFFHLGNQALANSLPANEEEIKAEQKYPLSLSFCKDCSLVQLNETIDPKELFSHYVWVTGTTEVAKSFAFQFADELLKRTKEPEKGCILELASNDGTFLIPFKEKKLQIQGVDPASNIAEMANKAGIPTRVDFWNKKCAERFLQTKGKAKIIFARNVVPHVADLIGFIQGINLALDDEGTAAIEVHYAKTILEDLHYDSIYHEHVHYFTLKTLMSLLERNGLYVFDLSWSPINAVGLVVYAKKTKNEVSKAVKDTLDTETRDKTNELASWEEFAKRAHKHRDDFLKLLNSYKGKGTVVGWGASARSSTLLNFCNVTPTEIQLIADSNPLKHNHYTAGTHIPIDDPKKVMSQNPACVVLLGWNFAPQIKEKAQNQHNYKNHYLIPLPNSPRVETA